MKIIVLCLLLTSCETTFKSPVTQIEYKGKIDSQGLSITAKPPFYDYLVQFYEYLTK